MLPLAVPPQLGERRLGPLQPPVWRRSADQDAALPEEGDLSEGGGGGSLPLPRHLAGPDPAVPHAGLPARVEHGLLVTGGFVKIRVFRSTVHLCYMPVCQIAPKLQTISLSSFVLSCLFTLNQDDKNPLMSMFTDTFISKHV